MKTSKKVLQNITLLAIVLIGFISCEKDFASIDSDVVNSDNATNFSTTFMKYPVRTYNKKVAPFQTNGLPANLLGYYNDPVYGNSTVNFVSQMTPTAYNPVFGENVVLDSVVLTIPFYATQTEISEDGNSTYKLDSVFGNTDDPMKLSVYRNNFFLRDFNPDLEFDAAQEYFSNGSSSSSDVISVSDLEGQLLYHSEEFKPSNKEIILTEIELEENGEPVLDEDENPIVNITSRQSPAIRIHLDNPNDTFWQELIFEKEDDIELSNQNNFINYFRGIYIKTEAINEKGTMMLLSLAGEAANITIYYTSDIENNDDSPDNEVEKEAGQFVLNFSGNDVSLYNNNFIVIPDGDIVNGDESLYLKGGEGSMAVVELFKGTIEDENGNQVDAFEHFKSSFREDNGDGTFTQKRLINEAYLEFFVNQNLLMGGEEPDRIYMFDPVQETALIDYFLDQSASNTQTNAKILHLEPLRRVDNQPNGEGIKYKIRVTEHLNNIIIRDSTNVKLGLVVTTNVNTIANYSSKNEADEDGITEMPAGALLSPKGTILYGNNTPIDEKKVKLTIYYTEPDN